MSTPTTERSVAVVDYDSDGYDYRTYWDDRAYERRAEAVALRRIFGRRPPVGWAADLGCGFGRNADHLLAHARHVVLVDYSVTNLRHAAQRYRDELVAGRIHLVRADLHALPLRDAAVDTVLAVRVLHHLPDLERCLPELVRVAAAGAVLDVPIKHHLLARLAALRATVDLDGPDPRVTGDTDFPFSAFGLDTVLDQLRTLGLDGRVAASVNNFRRWDRGLSAAGRRLCGPAVDVAERVAQRVGRGWWGPNQFVVAERRGCGVAFAAPDGTDASPLAARLRCPCCQGDLDWEPAAARCPFCELTYPRRHGFWDFAR